RREDLLRPDLEPEGRGPALVRTGVLHVEAEGEFERTIVRWRWSREGPSELVDAAAGGQGGLEIHLRPEGLLPAYLREAARPALDEAGEHHLLPRLQRLAGGFGRGGAARARARIGREEGEVGGRRPMQDRKGGCGSHPLEPRLPSLGVVAVEPGLENHAHRARPGRPVHAEAVGLEGEAGRPERRAEAGDETPEVAPRSE